MVSPNENDSLNQNRKIASNEPAKKRKPWLIPIIVGSVALAGAIGVSIYYFGFARTPASNAKVTDAGTKIRALGGAEVSGKLTLYENYEVEVSFLLDNPSTSKDTAILKFAFVSGRASNKTGYANVAYSDFARSADYSYATVTKVSEAGAKTPLTYTIPFYPTALTDYFSFKVSVDNGDSSFSLTRTVEAK